ncbi:Voltage-dependent T-type calcium channel subunit alpha-1I [Anabarilius grahami]|uniref:Voltage-dependent T-type calcium channel subunit alpha-1I n=1 Tax=Anabarilius grahami TaxID=495550 RepID=A0A3N0Y380_ANAGA|nr:Voltage-dependent T-type calcium channel subunit alpha-1I [Anabarilius grahami]
MTTEERPVPLGVSQVGAGLCEDFGPSQVDDIIEEVGPCDDAGSDISTLVVPFPDLAPVVFFCLKQTTCPRSWCIRMVLSPYPLLAGAHRSESLLYTMGTGLLFPTEAQISHCLNSHRALISTARCYHKDKCAETPLFPAASRLVSGSRKSANRGTF